MKTAKYDVFYALAPLFLLLSGCAPAFTHCTGNVSIGGDCNCYRTPPGRFIVISFWDYPSVNGSSGKIVLDEVIVTCVNRFTVDFPHAAYWVVWTPALGTQHLAPEPGIVVFHRDYMPIGNIGGTDPNQFTCCGKPKVTRSFRFVLSTAEPFRTDDTYCHPERDLFDRLAAKKANLARKLDSCKELTPDEHNMVFEKIRTVTQMPGAR